MTGKLFPGILQVLKKGRKTRQALPHQSILLSLRLNSIKGSERVGVVSSRAGFRMLLRMDIFLVCSLYTLDLLASLPDYIISSLSGLPPQATHH